MDLSDLILAPSQWLQPTGPESDIVLSTRVRLARNVAGRPFSSRLRPEDQQELAASLKSAIFKALGGRELAWFELDGMEEIDRRCLMERHLVSREFAAGQGPRGVAVDSTQRIAIMANEEDHLRLQVIFAGLQLEATWHEADGIDDRLEEHLAYAFSPKLGYLTACPTNVGTGMRASVMLHLPGLVLTRQIEKVFRAVARLRLAVRGLYGEGTQATGDFYQISNQGSLGKSEQEILKTLDAAIPQIVEYEKQARAVLVAESPTPLDDKIHRSWGLLTHARTISSDEALMLLSAVRLGIHLGRLKGVDIGTVNELFLLTRPGHIQKIRGAELAESERDIARADYIRKRLGSP
ncbi:MAG TPA: protein arginine kinase [Phycisphaerae bacterium]|nr:protein arginine kinase [Phycisphaerae bacterium]